MENYGEKVLEKCDEKVLENMVKKFQKIGCLLEKKPVFRHIWKGILL